MKIKNWNVIYNRIMQESATKMGLSLNEYLEFDGVCYQHTQGYYSNRQEEEVLLNRYWELINKGKENIKLWSGKK
jgi:hypothetical protein